MLNNYSFRIAMMYVALFLISSLILFVFIFISSTRSVTQQLDETLLTEKSAFIERYAQSGLNGLIKLVNTRAQSSARDGAYSISNTQNEIIAGNLAGWPSVSSKTGLLKFQHQYDDDEDPVSFRGEVIILPDNNKLLVARSRQYIIAEQQQLVQIFISAAIITLLLGLLGGYFLSKRTVRRISNINRLCRTIIEGDFSQRLRFNQSHDDLYDLSLNINSMLDKIETLMHDIKQVSDNIAHDMRTPLAHLRLKLETLQTQSAQKQHAGISDIQAGLDEAVIDSDEIINTFNALLRISKINAKNIKASFVPLDLSTLLLDVVELYAPVAEDKNLVIEKHIFKGLQIIGDKNLLFQAFSNLLDNACKYTPENGAISLRAEQRNNKIIFRLCDNGIGVDEEAIKHLSKRFYRADASRSLPGNGLGLSLVFAIAKAHQATMQYAHNTPQGLCVKLIFKQVYKTDKPFNKSA